MKRFAVLFLIIFHLTNLSAESRFVSKYDIGIGEEGGWVVAVTISCGNKFWNINLPEEQNMEEPVLLENEEGFSLVFDYGAGKYHWIETFFFEDGKAEPFLYKILTKILKDGEIYGEYETSVFPEIKISELTSKKMEKLFGNEKINNSKTNRK